MIDNFYTNVIANDPQFHSTSRIADPLLLEPVTRNAVAAVIADAKAHGVELMLFETFRSQERQEALFEQGATKLRHVGVHHYGLAADLVKSIDGEPSWKGDFSLLGTLARAHGLIWGGDWGSPGVAHSFVDADHVQRIPLARQTSLFSGVWYPSAIYDCYRDS
jgi:hypothetical protein